MAVLVMSVDSELNRKIKDEAKAGNIPEQSHLLKQFKLFLRTTYPTTFVSEEPIPAKSEPISDKQQALQELIHIAKANFLVEYTFADVIQASGCTMTPAESSTLASMFANATKKPDSRIVNLGKQGGSKVTIYINKMD